MIDASQLKKLQRKMDNAKERVNDSIKQSAMHVSITMVGYAKQNAHVRTGNMRNSIIPIDTKGYVVDSDGSIVMGARATASYSIFEEYGTGPLGDPVIPHTSKMRWWYWDRTMVHKDGSIGGFRMGKSRAAHPFMRPALKEHIEEYKQIIKGNIGEVILK